MAPDWRDSITQSSKDGRFKSSTNVVGPGSANPQTSNIITVQTVPAGVNESMYESKVNKFLNICGTTSFNKAGTT